MDFDNEEFVHEILEPEESLLNKFSPSSSVQSLNEKLPDLYYNKRILRKIVDEIFDAQVGAITVSSSECSSVGKKSSEYSYDRRLKYWKTMITDRKKMQEGIIEKTGKHPRDVLFNRPTTIDERDKQMVKRVIDYADRLAPIALMTKPLSKLPEYVDPQTCLRRYEVLETLPKAEREKCTDVEITGLPAVTREEQLGKHKEGKKNRHHWMYSRVLEQRIEEKREDIERVVEHFPDIEYLQIVGESIIKESPLVHNSDIELIKEDRLEYISSETSLCEEKLKTDKLSPQEKQYEYAIKINEQLFHKMDKRSTSSIDIETRFECEPYENVIKRVLRIENMGKKVITGDWVKRMYYPKTPQLLRSYDNEFKFNHSPFRLMAGEVREFVVLYQPRRVGVFKEKWLLRIEPKIFFCRKVDAIMVKMSGKCRASPEYAQKVDSVLSTVINKSNDKMMRKLTNGLASLTPLIKPSEVVCPYQRIFTERELFEHYNIGYKCERFHDLEMLKDIHKRAKKPREHPWDLTLDALKETILRLENADNRAFLFSEMTAILEEMKGYPEEYDETKIQTNPERDRSRVVFVRGTISTAIDNWEELIVGVEEAFFKPALKEYYTQVEEEEETQLEEMEESVVEVLLLDEEQVKELVLRKVRRNKAYRDTLYVQTYSHMCDLIENIVSVIESTEVI